MRRAVAAIPGWLPTINAYINAIYSDLRCIFILQITLPAPSTEINNQNVLNVLDNVSAVEICAEIFDQTFIGFTEAIHIALSVHWNMIV